MKTFFLNNIRVLLLIIFIFIVIILFHIFDYKEPKKSNDIYEFSTIKEGDIIPFNSRIVGEFNLHMKYISHDNNVSHYIKSKIVKANHTNVYYCTNEKCLNNQEVALTKNLYSVGSSTLYDYNVSNYNHIFGSNNKEYTGWEAHFLPFVYYNEIFHTMYMGTYYDLVLVPTSRTTNKCLESIDSYGISREYEIIDKSDTWNVEDNNFYLDENSEGYIDIKFKAKKGDKILFDLNTSSSTLSIKLNDINITSQFNLYAYENLFRYNTKMIDIEEDNTYILRISEDISREDDKYIFDRIVNIKNFIIFSPSDKDKSDTYYTGCKNDIIVGEV